FDAAGSEQGFNVFSKDSVKGGAPFTIALSGTAPPPSAAAQSQGGDNAAAGAPAGAPGVTVETAPARLDDQKWILLGGLAAIFAVGVGLLLRKPMPELATAPAAPAGSKSRRAQKPEQRAAQAQAKAAATTAPPARPVERV